MTDRNRTVGSMHSKAEWYKRPRCLRLYYAGRHRKELMLRIESEHRLSRSRKTGGADWFRTASPPSISKLPEGCEDFRP